MARTVGYGDLAVGVFLGHAPSQVEVYPKLFDMFAHSGKTDRDQMVPLGVHIADLEEMAPGPPAGYAR